MKAVGVQRLTADSTLACFPSKNKKDNLAGSLPVLASSRLMSDNATVSTVMGGASYFNAEGGSWIMRQTKTMLTL